MDLALSVEGSTCVSGQPEIGERTDRKKRSLASRKRSKLSVFSLAGEDGLLVFFFFHRRGGVTGVFRTKALSPPASAHDTRIYPSTSEQVRAAYYARIYTQV